MLRKAASYPSHTQRFCCLDGVEVDQEGGQIQEGAEDRGQTPEKGQFQEADGQIPEAGGDQGLLAKGLILRQHRKNLGIFTSLN